MNQFSSSSMEKVYSASRPAQTYLLSVVSSSRWTYIPSLQATVCKAYISSFLRRLCGEEHQCPVPRMPPGGEGVWMWSSIIPGEAVEHLLTPG